MHSIRLAGPWQLTPLARTCWSAEGESVEEPGTLPEGGRSTVPSDWGELLGEDFRGQVQMERFFHKPTGLEADDRVEIVLSGVDAMGTASLNGQLLGNIPAGGEPARFEISRLLEHRNCLVVNVELPRLTSQSAPLARPAAHREAGGILGEVRLEIIPPG
jgi:hypothetical protein